MSNSWGIPTSWFLKFLSFFSFQITQMHENQIIRMIEPRILDAPAKWLNWTKRSNIVYGSTDEKAIQFRTIYQMELKNCMLKIGDLMFLFRHNLSPKLWVLMKNVPSKDIIFRRNLLRKRRQANQKTFTRTSFCQSNSEA